MGGDPTITESPLSALPDAATGQLPEPPVVEPNWAKRKTAERHLFEAEAGFASARASLVAAMEELLSSGEGELQRVAWIVGDVVSTAEAGQFEASGVRRVLEQLRPFRVAADGAPSCRR